jgi:hypothetical protein
VLQNVHDAIVRAAQENGLDPSMAIAIADRESSGNVNSGLWNGQVPTRQSHGASSAYGLFQLLGAERGAYGGSSQDPYEQATAWAHYIQGTRAEMVKGLGREPTGPELYLGHYFGGTRAARLVSGQIPSQTPVQAIFSPQELAANPNIGRAGTTGALSSSIMADISRRQNRFGGDAGTGGPSVIPGTDDKNFDPAKLGTPFGAHTSNTGAPQPTAAQNGSDFDPSTIGTPFGAAATPAAPSAPAAPATSNDFDVSKVGTLFGSKPSAPPQAQTQATSAPLPPPMSLTPDQPVSPA